MASGRGRAAAEQAHAAVPRRGRGGRADLAAAERALHPGIRCALQPTYATPPRRTTPGSSHLGNRLGTRGTGNRPGPRPATRALLARGRATRYTAPRSRRENDAALTPHSQVTLLKGFWKYRLPRRAVPVTHTLFIAREDRVLATTAHNMLRLAETCIMLVYGFSAARHAPPFAHSFATQWHGHAALKS